MIKNAIILFLCISMRGVFAQGSKSEKISEIFDKIEGDTSCSNPNMILFLKEFPSSFRELNEVYGWDDKNNVRRELNKVTEQHLELFGKMYGCFPKQWTQKSIRIALNGKWDADAVNYFQDLLQKKIGQNPNLYFFYLSKFTDKENISFWKFIIDGPFKHEPTILKFKNITVKDSIQSKYFKAAVRLKWGK